jgi:hypothetical protein
MNNNMNLNALQQGEERKLLEDAIRALQNAFPLEAKVETRIGLDFVKADAILKFTFEDKLIEYFAEVKQTANKALKNQFLIQKKRIPNLLLVTNHVNPDLAAEFAKENLEFIDAAGNAFLNRQGLFLFIKGNKPAKLPRDIQATKPFPPQALKVVFALLCEKELVEHPYRDIANRANVALGTVAYVMKKLELLGFLINRRGTLALMKKERLLQRWILEYNTRLRPKLFIGRYRAEPGWWNQAQLPFKQAWWGGEVAAAKLTHYLRPEFVTIYTQREYLDELILKNRLKRDVEGNVEFLQKFWAEGMQGIEGNVVHPILIYADLLGTADQRNLETAAMLYEREVAGLIGKD